MIHNLSVVLPHPSYCIYWEVLISLVHFSGTLCKMCRRNYSMYVKQEVLMVNKCTDKADKDYCLLRHSSMYSDTLHTNILEGSAISMSRILVQIYQNTWHHISEDHSLQWLCGCLSKLVMKRCNKPLLSSSFFLSMYINTALAC